MEIENRINELIELINKASYEYYVLDNPTITDQEYDDAYKELLTLEEQDKIFYDLMNPEKRSE